MAHIGREETYCRGGPGKAGGSCPGQQILLLESQSVQDSMSTIGITALRGQVAQEHTPQPVGITGPSFTLKCESRVSKIQI